MTSEPVGWNVYYGGSTGNATFDHFQPNEPVLAREAAKLAEDVERSLAADG